ncbi:RNA-binding protein Musashi Rbp6-like 2, partial [Homarus americanus]
MNDETVSRLDEWQRDSDCEVVSVDWWSLITDQRLKQATMNTIDDSMIPAVKRYTGAIVYRTSRRPPIVASGSVGLVKGDLNKMDGVSPNEHMNGSSGASQGGSSGRSSPSDPAPNKMFVGGLSWQTTPEKLREYFGSYGTVRDVLIMKDPVTQRSRGFGFITFGDASSVEKVIAVPNHVLDGKKIDPKHATPKNKGRTNRTKKIFVGGVSQETSADEVEEAVMLMDNQTKRHRGFGFVTFECEDVVERVCDIHFHTIKNKKVECKKAQPGGSTSSLSAIKEADSEPDWSCQPYNDCPILHDTGDQDFRFDLLLRPQEFTGLRCKAPPALVKESVELVPCWLHSTL